MKAKGTGIVKHWEEKTHEQISPHMKMTKASVEYAFEGEINGKALVEYLMFYRYVDPEDQHKSSATYVGLMAFSGKLSGKEGSFVLEDTGTFDSGTAVSTLRIISGSGLGELNQITGTGNYRANQAGHLIELDYSL
jgi:Protein of unknown function (DUF3224)